MLPFCVPCHVLDGDESRRSIGACVSRRANSDCSAVDFITQKSFESAVADLWLRVGCKVKRPQVDPPPANCPEFKATLRNCPNWLKKTDFPLSLVRMRYLISNPSVRCRIQIAHDVLRIARNFGTLGASRDCGIARSIRFWCSRQTSLIIYVHHYSRTFPRCSNRVYVLFMCT